MKQEVRGVSRVMHRSSLPILKSFRVGARTREERTVNLGFQAFGN